MFKLIKKAYVKHLNAQVEKYWNIYHFDMNPNHTSYNNEGDAFKHTYWSAEMTLFLGQTIAEKIGIYWEDANEHNTPEERRMDLHNNSVGREIGKGIKKKWLLWMFKDYDDEIAFWVMGAMRSGKLITKP